MKFGLSDQIINSIIQVLESNSKVDKAFVFGSRAKGNYRDASDIDIAIQGNDLNFDDVLQLGVKLDDLNLPFKVDLLNYHSIKEPNLTDHIDRMGIEFYSRWKEIQLRNISSDISYGYTASASNENVGPKFLRITDITSGRINWETVPFCKISDKDLKKYKLGIGDIVIARTGATTGFNAIIKNKIEAVYASYLIRFQIDKNQADPIFVGYVLQSNNFQDYVDAIVGGSAQPGANAQQFADYEFVLPPLQEQTTIASILSSLDDKIDLLHRQNKTLEQLAETLFRQWFVEEAEEDDLVRLGDVIKTSSGGTPSRSKMEYYHNGTVKWVKSKELQGSFIFDTEEKVTDEAVKNSSAKLFPANTILIAMYGATVGEYAILAEPATCNQAVCGLIPNEDFPFTFLFVLTKYNKENLIGLAGGSAQQNISQELIKDIEIPNSTVKINEYHKIVEPYFQKIKSNQTQIRTLTQTRDTLLPKLMSGEVRVNL